MIHLDVKDKYAIISFDRQEAMNALNSEVIQELSKIMDQIEGNKSIRAIIFTGKGKAFVAGADIKEMIDLRGNDIYQFSIRGRDLFRRIEKLPIVTIAAINGYALGGGLELALCCDIRLASDRAKMGFPEVSLGVIPGFSGTQRLPRLIGKMQAVRLLTTAEIINSDEAKELGLVCNVYSEDELMHEAEKIAQKIASNSKTAIAGILLSIDKGLGLPMDYGMEIETGIMTAGFGTEDQIEGMHAFCEKRKPNFN